MDAYGQLWSRLLHPAWERARGRSTYRLLEHLKKTQYRSLDELEAMQVGALRRLLHHAFLNVPAQRASMQAHGFHPNDVKSTADLRALPILDRKALQAMGKGRASTAEPFGTIFKTTSGSTGEPLDLCYDRGSEDWRQAVKLRGYGWAGWGTGSNTMHYWGVGRKLPSRWKRTKIALDRRLKREQYVDCGRRGDADLALVVDALRKQQPEFLIGFSQALADLSRYVVAQGARTWKDIRVLACAERLFPSDREVVIQAFGPHVFETYGSREVMLMGAECEAHDGMHLAVENLLFEVVVREPSGIRAAKPGETGELVVTDLHNYGMPMIRYALGDNVTAGALAPCTCGRTLPRLASVDGRQNDTFRGPNGSRVNGLLLHSIGLALGEKCKAWQVVQHRDDSVTFRLVVEGLDPSEDAQLLRDARKYLGELPIRVERVNDIPLSPSGKRKLVVIEPT